MSHRKNRDEAFRWLTTAGDDLDSAVILKQNNKHAHACFHAQQAVEKAIKGLWYFYDADPWGHSILKLIRDLEAINVKAYALLSKYVEEARKLDRLYIPTRYPNGLPDITPDMAYSQDDSQYSLTAAKKIIKDVEAILKETKDQV
jgi:HEPN domain-containing protein